MTTNPVQTGPSKLLITLIAVGGVLLLAVVATGFLLIGQSSAGASPVTATGGTPTPASTDIPATPDATPTPEPTTGGGTQAQNGNGNGGNGGNGGGGGGAQAPADKTLRFTSFNADLEVACDPTGESDEKAQPQISWSAVNATAVYWTPNSSDATSNNGYKVGSTGNQDTMSASKGAGERYEFPCNHRGTFDTTVTIYGANGQKVSKHVTFTDINWNEAGSDDE